MTLSMDAYEVITQLVVGLHRDKNSNNASGLVEDDPRAYYYGKENAALGVTLKIDVRSHEHGVSLSKLVTFLFARPWGNEGFCTTHTFARVLGDDGDGQQKPFDFLSSHDSCWKSAVRDFLWEVECELVKELSEECGIEEPPHSSFHWMVTAPLLRPMFQWVKVVINKDSEDDRNYKKLIQVL